MYETRGSCNLTMYVPYDTLDSASWGNEGIRVKMDIVSLLKMVLPAACFSGGDCCAVKFANERDRAASLKKAAAALDAKARPDAASEMIKMFSKDKDAPDIPVETENPFCYAGCDDVGYNPILDYYDRADI